MKNKKGWIKIVEAVIAVLLVASVLIVVANRGSLGREEISQKVYSIQVAILKEIQQDNSLRDSITSNSLTLPVEWESFDSSGLSDVKNKVVSRTPDYLTCEARICEPSDLCDYVGSVSKNIYAYSILITVSPEAVGFTPRQIKLFCWTEE